MKFFETPASRFSSLEDFPYEPHHCVVDPCGLKMHYIDEGPRDGEVVVLLHGEPTWSYLYRKMIPVFLAAGYRVIAPDLIGFGRSSKPSKVQDHSYERHVTWMGSLFDELKLTNVNLFVQDWGSLIGLRMVGEQPERFARVVVGNGFLPTGRPLRFNKASLIQAAVFLTWKTYALHVPRFVCSSVIARGTALPLSEGAKRAYDAPFPEKRDMAGPRAMPALVPLTPKDPAHVPNTAAWEGLARFDKPFLTLFSTGDPITRGLEKKLIRRIAGAADQPHHKVRGGHFLQEDAGPELAERMVDFMRS